MKVFSVAYNGTKSAALAEEIVQEIFISLWINRKTVFITTSIKAYLLGAVRHKVFDYIEKKTVRARYKNDVMKHASMAHNDTQETIDFNDLSYALNKHIQTLPEPTKHIFLLSRFNGLSNAEIAQQYAFSTKAVEYHLTKAIKHLRLYLKHVYMILFFLVFSA